MYDEGSSLFTFSTIFVIVFLNSHSSGFDVISHSGFDLPFLLTNDVEYIFIYLLAFCISSLKKYLCRAGCAGTLP
jgi:hypothetical protein